MLRISSRQLQLLLLLSISLGCLYGCVLSLRRTPAITWTVENSLLFAKTPILSDDRDIKSLVTALDNSLKYLSKLSPEESKRFGADKVTVHEMQDTILDLRENILRFGLTESLYRYVAENYRFFKTGAEVTLVTGYYEARLRGARERSLTYRYPIYRKPPDLVRGRNEAGEEVQGRRLESGEVVPYFTREEIDYGERLSGKGLEIVWVDDPIDLFFLHIQGSGIVTIPGERPLRLSFAEKNGHPYRPIGKALIERGLLRRENVSMQTIRAFLRAHPERRQEIISYDTSYVFFREVEDGPIGNLGVPVTPWRSIATDVRLFPKGAHGFLQSELPVFDADGQVVRWQPFSRFIVNQDTGGAIRGADHIDLFTGYGKTAEAVAGVMKQPGTFYLFRKKRAEEREVQ